MQNLEHHCLSSEFPELKAQIHTLKMNDAHFRRLHEAYTDLSKRIENMETEVTPTATADEEELKMERVHLKDTLYQMLTAS